MKKYFLITKLLLVSLSIMLLFTVLGCEKYEKGQVTISAPAMKEYTIKHIDVINVDTFHKIMKEHIGKVVLVNFFGSWCPPCKAETPDFVDVYNKYKDQNIFVIIGVAVDQSQQDALKFINEYNITYPVYQADSSLLEYFQIQPIPTSFVYDKSGSLLDSIVGYMSRGIVEQVVEFAQIRGQ